MRKCECGSSSFLTMQEEMWEVKVSISDKGVLSWEEALERTDVLEFPASEYVYCSECDKPYLISELKQETRDGV